jgi:hypothetical protein
MSWVRDHWEQGAVERRWDRALRWLVGVIQLPMVGVGCRETYFPYCWNWRCCPQQGVRPEECAACSESVSPTSVPDESRRCSPTTCKEHSVTAAVPLYLPSYTINEAVTLAPNFGMITGYLTGLESREYCHRDLSGWLRGTLYPQKLALTLPTSGCCSVGIVRSRTQATEFSLVFFYRLLKWIFLSPQVSC